MKNPAPVYLYAEDPLHIFAIRVARVATLTVLGATDAQIVGEDSRAPLYAHNFGKGIIAPF